jgi:hypothetical protein
VVKCALRLVLFGNTIQFKKVIHGTKMLVRFGTEDKFRQNFQDIGLAGFVLSAND